MRTLWIESHSDDRRWHTQTFEENQNSNTMGWSIPQLAYVISSTFLAVIGLLLMTIPYLWFVNFGETQRIIAHEKPDDAIDNEVLALLRLHMADQRLYENSRQHSSSSPIPLSGQSVVNGSEPGQSKNIGNSAPDVFRSVVYYRDPPARDKWTGMEGKFRKILNPSNILEFNSTVNCKRTGPFLLSLGVSIEHKYLAVRVRSSREKRPLFTISAIADGRVDTVGRTWLAPCAKDTRVTVEYRGHPHHGWMFSWSGWRLDPAVTSFYRFWTSDRPGVVGAVTFTSAISSEGQGAGAVRNTSSSAWIVPQKGIYLFHYSAASYPREDLRLQLRKNGAVVHEVLRTRNVLNHSRVISGSAMIRATPDDVIQLTLEAGRMFSDGIRRETTLLGVLYNPTTVSAAWSLSKRRAQTGGKSKQFVNVSFDEVIIARRIKLFNRKTIQIYTGGFYHISATVGCFPRAVCMVYVLVNHKRVIASAYRRSLTAEGRDTLSATVVAKLETRDLVTLALWDETEVYSNDNQVTGFMGMLLHPT